jgi:hypothetical protein
MTTAPHTGLLCDNPGELIAAVPGLLRFHPTDSIVLITYAGPHELHLEAVLRMDLPNPDHISAVADQLRVVALNHDAAVAEILVFGGLSGSEVDPPQLPHRELVEELGDALDRGGVVLAHAVWAPNPEPGQTWWCYEDPECSGQVEDPTGSPVVAALTIAGVVTYTSRDELAASLTPDPPDALQRRSELLAALPPVDPSTEFPFVRKIIDATDPDPGTEPDLDDATIARLAAALSDADVREACLSFALTPRAGPAERLWTALTRAAPPEAVAGPAILLAVCTYLRGDGALASVAIEVARSADPTHRMARTVRRIMDCGLPPHKFRAMLAQSFVRAFTER